MSTSVMIVSAGRNTAVENGYKGRILITRNTVPIRRIQSGRLGVVRDVARLEKSRVGRQGMATGGGPVMMAASGSASTMRIRIQGRHMEATPAIKEFVEDKVTKTLSNYEGAVKEVDVTVSASGNHGKASQAHHQRNQKAEVTVYTLRHGVVRVEDTEDDLYAAVDLVMDKLKRKMLKVKEKAIQKNTWPGRGGTKGGDVIEDHLPAADASMDEDLPIDQMAPEAAPQIVREKVLLLSEKMSPEDAAEQLEAVGHDFFLFVDAKDGIMKCVYRREYHGYGLIIPQVA